MVDLFGGDDVPQFTVASEYDVFRSLQRSHTNLKDLSTDLAPLGII